VNGSAVDSYTYSYDNLGNITVVNRNNGQPIYYTYDAQNQLIRAVEGVYRYEYTYDTYGNILTVKYYDDDIEELISSNTYSYTDSQWVDQLKKFNGVEFDYDQIGNPTKYYNGSNYTFTWNGRELATAVKGSTSVSYKYGADGLRTQKTVGSTVYDYYYIDGLLVRQTWGTNYMDFLYDESGSPYSFIYNGTQYYYIKNLQGDVMRIVNTSGTVVANYFYDAWGKVTNSGNIIGLYNPIRYRGYYYDTDTGFYYLQSRYYDPAIKRFISADSSVNANGDILGFNMYAYTNNNSINFSYNNSSTTGSVSGKDRMISSIDASNHSTGTPNSRSFSKGGLWLSNGIDTGSTIHGLVSSSITIYRNIRYFSKNLKVFSDDMTMIGTSMKDGILAFNQFSWGLDKIDILGVFLGAGLDVYDSIQRGVSTGGTILGATLTTTKNVGLIYLNKGILYGTTALGGCIGPEGAVAGFVVGVVICIGVDLFVSPQLDGLIDKIAQ